MYSCGAEPFWVGSAQNFTALPQKLDKINIIKVRLQHIIPAVASYGSATFEVHLKQSC